MTVALCALFENTLVVGAFLLVAPSTACRRTVSVSEKEPRVVFQKL